MSEVNVIARGHYRPKPRPDITIEGEIWKPRSNFAAAIGVTDKTCHRMNLRTAYIGGIAYVPMSESLREVAARARRRHEPEPVRRRRRA